MMTTTKHPPWDSNVVEGVANVLGETSYGLTGSEIGSLLHRCKVPDLLPGATKRHRLREALLVRQSRDQASNCVIKFISEAMQPVRYGTDPALFSRRQGELNEVLVHVGLGVTAAGKLARGPLATTLTEAARHASSLRAELRRRGAHAEVLRFCTQEVLERNWFHASLEAAKSVPERLRSMTGEQGDGAALVDAVLSLGTHGNPRVRINSLTTESERDEQKGFANLCKGVLGMFRNPIAHDPRVNRSVTDEELLELLMVLSMIHRRLDGAAAVP